MKITVNIPTEVDVKKVKVKAGVRYWEDGTIDGVEDVNGDLIPCRKGELWCPIINIDTGQILNWKEGVVASVHYKVCDAGSYYLLDENDNTLLSIENDYVPNELINGDYGDYIIMTIDEKGFISNWNPDLSDFIDSHDD